jgi:hypothetical protein
MPNFAPGLFFKALPHGRAGMLQAEWVVGEGRSFTWCHARQFSALLTDAVPLTPCLGVAVSSYRSGCDVQSPPGIEKAEASLLHPRC